MFLKNSLPALKEIKRNFAGCYMLQCILFDVYSLKEGGKHYKQTIIRSLTF